MTLKISYFSKENLLLILNKMIQFRSDFKKVMKEKSEVEMMQEKQRLELDNIAFELERKMTHYESPISSPKKSKNSFLFNNINMNFSTPQRTSMLNFFKLKNSNLQGIDNQYSTKESPLLSNFKTQVFDGFDTSQRINSNMIKSSRKLFKIEEIQENHHPYLIKNTFIKKGTSSQVGLHRQIKSEVPFINKEMILDGFKSTK